jgi:hypothetical protein
MTNHGPEVQPELKQTEVDQSLDLEQTKRERMLQAFRERDKPLLATPKAHGPG